ncbi:MAG: glutamate synthase central domain-containing protein, partial [Desulfatiglandales bacterium]|nr:glutamate synthase central domain-containing protein [Desulfatiglandales bacterium]
MHLGRIILQVFQAIGSILVNVLEGIFFVGTEKNLLAETPEHCRQLKLSHPILTNDDMERLRKSNIENFSVCT